MVEADPVSSHFPVPDPNSYCLALLFSDWSSKQSNDRAPLVGRLVGPDA
jgi:hypothetical protein